MTPWSGNGTRVRWPMLLTLKHLLVTIGLLALGVGGFLPLVGMAHLPQGISWICGLGVALPLLGLSWPLYRLMHLRPIGLPPCLHCGKLHGNYHVPADAWPCGVLICVWCGKPTRFHMTRKEPLDTKADMPNLYLHWPEFVGLWRAIQNPTNKVRTCLHNPTNQ